MSKLIFNEKQIRILKNNKNVKAVSEKSITYTDDFKKEFILKSETGMFPREIFEEAGFDTEMLGKKRVQIFAYRWRKKYKKGEILEDTRKSKSGRSLKRELSSEEIIARLEAKNKLLEAENELLKKTI